MLYHYHKFSFQSALNLIVFEVPDMRAPFRLFLAAALSSAAIAIDHTKYLRLSEGDEWIMDVTVLDPNGNVTKGTATRKTGGTYERGGKTYYRIFTKVDAPPIQYSFTKLCRKDESGYYSVDPKATDLKETTELLFPLEVGQTWSRTFSRGTTADTLLGLETVVIKGKTYENCIHVHSVAVDKSYTEDYWDGPSVGNVKSEIVYANGHRITVVLSEFKPGKK